MENKLMSDLPMLQVAWAYFYFISSYFSRAFFVNITVIF